MFLASVVQKLDKAGASVIAFDIVLDRPTTEADDSALAAAISAAETPIILLSDPGQAARRAICAGEPVENGDAGQPMTQFSDAADIGHGVLCLDGLDGVLRNMARGEAPQSFSAGIASRLAPDLEQGLAGQTIGYGLTPDGSWPFPTYSGADLEVLPDAWFEGRAVIIGQITPYSSDWVSSPLRYGELAIPVAPQDQFPNGQIPGVVAHAFMVQTLLNARPGPQTTLWQQAFLAFLGGGLGAMLSFLRLPLWLEGGALSAVLAFFWLMLFVAYAMTGVLLPFTGFTAALLVSSAANFAFLKSDERQQRRMIHSQFSQFLAPEVVNDLVRHPEKLNHHVENREITALFTDLADFTSLIDTLPPDTISTALNGYLDTIVQCVVRHGGVVDKIVGDAVHALFSVPLTDPDHRIHALQCALDIKLAAGGYRARLIDQGVQLGITRVGVNSGPALVGNFGSSKRLDFTAHGSTVNMVARLEAANKVFGTEIAVSAASRVDHPDLAWRKIGAVELRGLAGPVEVFELIAPDSIAQDDLEEYVAAFALIETDPNAAAGQFQALLDRYPQDGLLAYQIERCRAQKGHVS